MRNGKVTVLHMPVGNVQGGLTQYVVNHWRAIDRSRFAFEFATRSPTLPAALCDRDSVVHHLSCSSLEDEGRFVGEMRGILRRGYDAIHLHTCRWNGLWAERLAMEAGCPLVIVHAHNSMVDIEDEAARRRTIALHEQVREEFSDALANRFYACSWAAAEWIFGSRIGRERIGILPNAIDVPAFAFNAGTRKAVRDQMGWNGCLVLGSVGRFAYQKNHGFLLEAFSRVRRQNDRARLVLVGEGPLREEMRRCAGELGVLGSVAFLGRRNDVARLLQGFDLYLQPSRFEGLALTLVEAQAAGLPCFAGDNLAPETAITPRLRFLPYSVDAWAEAVAGCAPDCRREDGAHEAAAAGYAVADQVRVLEDIYLGKTENASMNAAR